MTVEELETYLGLLRSKGWGVERGGADGLAPAGAFAARHRTLPEDYAEFLRRVASCVNADETVWFLCAADYNGESASAFAWDEFERMSLEAAEGDERAARDVREFWDRHVPFLLSVKADYAYLAFSVGGGDDHGSIVVGHAPDTEAVTKVCDSFADFVRLHAAHLNGEADDPDLQDFM